jgi:phage gp37-like protein
MTRNDHTAAWAAVTTADLQDIATFDRLAGQLAPESALRRYAHESRANASGRRENGGSQRLLAAVRRLYGEQRHLRRERP